MCNCGYCEPSQMGQVRRAELDAARASLQRLKDEQAAGRYGGTLDDAEARVRRAEDSMARLHEDWVFIEAYN